MMLRNQQNSPNECVVVAIFADWDNQSSAGELGTTVHARTVSLHSFPKNG
jgi:hypothetical protein